MKGEAENTHAEGDNKKRYNKMPGSSDTVTFTPCTTWRGYH